MIEREWIPGRSSRPPICEIALGLYQGGALPLGATFRDLGVSAIVDLATEPHRAPPPPLGRVYVRWPFPDGPDVDPPTTRAVANLVKGLVEAGHIVLVHCTGGLNRSALVVTRSLIAMGWDPQEAVSHVRARRGDPRTLSNRRFEEWLYGETPGT